MWRRPLQQNISFRAIPTESRKRSLFIPTWRKENSRKNSKHFNNRKTIKKLKKEVNGYNKENIDNSKCIWADEF